MQLHPQDHFSQAYPQWAFYATVQGGGAYISRTHNHHECEQRRYLRSRASRPRSPWYDKAHGNTTANLPMT
jgi:hypothetical protein